MEDKLDLRVRLDLHGKILSLVSRIKYVPRGSALDHANASAPDHNIQQAINVVGVSNTLSTEVPKLLRRQPLALGQQLKQ